MSEAKNRNQEIIEEFRANRGKVGGAFANRTLLLLNTTGAKSGLPRVVPLVCMRNGNCFVIIASKGGAPTHPDWYYNLLAHPNVCVEFGSEQFEAIASVAEEPERTQLYEAMAARYSFFADYAKQVTRIIPVIILTPKQ